MPFYSHVDRMPSASCSKQFNESVDSLNSIWEEGQIHTPNLAPNTKEPSWSTTVDSSEPIWPFIEILPLHVSLYTFLHWRIYILLTPNPLAWRNPLSLVTILYFSIQKHLVSSQTWLPCCLSSRTFMDKLKSASPKTKAWRAHCWYVVVKAFKIAYMCTCRVSFVTQCCKHPNSAV